jgi:hypothetical protein
MQFVKTIIIEATDVIGVKYLLAITEFDRVK